MTNLELFEYCKKNPEKFLDTNYMFIEKNPKLDLYREKTKVIKNKLIAIKEVLNKENSNKILDQLYKELQKELGLYANYSEFGAFVNACDSKIEEVFNDITLLKKITVLYLQKRNLNDIVPSEWIQALIDKGSSRKKGKAGENKLIALLNKFGFLLTKSAEEFNKIEKSVAKFTPSGDFSNLGIKKQFGVEIGKDTQNKKLDLVIKDHKEFYFLEAKHLNTGGGGQDKQVLELIKVISTKPKSNNHHFLGFLDGLHSNTILNASETEDKEIATKEKLQHKAIIEALKINKNNYWLNTAGFKKLFNKN